MNHSFIPYSCQTIDEDDIEAVSQSLRSNLITQGPRLEEFENEVAQFCGASYAVGFMNGTAALHAAHTALGLSSEHEGLCPAITFLATANSMRYLGATPLFVDTTADLPMMDPNLCEGMITQRTKVISPVDFSGTPAPLAEIHTIAKKHQIYVVDDASHAFGAEYQVKNQWHRVGSCDHADMTIFSFHPVKTITTGEGGMVTTNDEILYEDLRAIRHHGIRRGNYKDKPAWYYEVESLGYNFRMTEMQAALGLSQLKKWETFRNKREALFARYQQAFSSINEIQLLTPQATQRSSHHLCIIQLATHLSRDELYQHLKEKDIGTQVHYMPLYRHPLYQQQQNLNLFPRAENYFSRSLSIPLYPNLSFEQQDYVIENIINWVRKH